MELYPIRSVGTVNYTGALAQNAVANANLILGSALQGVGAQSDPSLHGNSNNIIQVITILSKENLAWELQWFGKDTFQTTDVDTDSFISRWSFAANDGVQDAASGLWRYYIDGLSIPYLDLDNSGEVHQTLVNRSAAAKTAGAPGAVSVTVWMSPMQVGF